MDRPRSEYVTDLEVKSVQDGISRVEQLLLQLEETLLTNPTDSAKVRQRLLTRELKTRKELLQTRQEDQRRRKLSKPHF